MTTFAIFKRQFRTSSNQRLGSAFGRMFWMTKHTNTKTRCATTRSKAPEKTVRGGQSAVFTQNLKISWLYTELGTKLGCVLVPRTQIRCIPRTISEPFYSKRALSRRCAVFQSKLLKCMTKNCFANMELFLSTGKKTLSDFFKEKLTICV